MNDAPRGNHKRTLTIDVVLEDVTEEIADEFKERLREEIAGDLRPAELRVFIDGEMVMGEIVRVHADPGLPAPPEHLREAWERYQHGGENTEAELRALDEWRVDCARDAGF